jgi:hypothetical protein
MNSVRGCVFGGRGGGGGTVPNCCRYGLRWGGKCIRVAQQDVRVCLARTCTHPCCLAAPFRDGRDSTGKALLSLLLCLGVLWAACTLHHARAWAVFNPLFRDLVADYGPSLTVVAFTALAHIPRFDALGTSYLTVPDKFGTTSGRSWLVPFLDSGLPGV